MDVKSFDEIYEDMRNYIIAHQDKLTDFNDGGVLESQIEATARELALLYIRARVGFSTHLRSLPYSIFDFRQKAGLRASAKIVLSRSKPFSYETPLPAGTIVAAGGLRFLTSEVSFVGSGEIDSPLISAIAQDVGDKYNVGSGMVKTIVSTLSADIVKVNNPDPATGGEDAEDWAAYVDRFADFILGLQRTNASGLLSGLDGKRLIRSMSIEEHFPPLAGLWNVTFYLEDGSGGMTPEALAEAKRIIDGNISKGINGYRAPGVNIRYLPPEVIPVTTHITVETERDIANEVDQSIIANEVIDTVRKFINSLECSNEETKVQISDITVTVKRLANISNVRVTYPVNDIIISPGQIPRYEDCIVTVET